MATTPPPEEAGCSECYMLGVLFALAGSTFQAVGLSLWKLSHVRGDKAEAERLVRVRIREERKQAYQNKPSTPDDASTASHSKQKDANSEIAESLSSGSHNGEHRITVTNLKDGKSLPDINELEEEEPQAVQPGPCGGISWIWLIGFIIFAIGNGGDFIALGITKQSVVTLVGSWALVVNTLTARLLLHEIVHPLDVLSSVLIIVGIVLTVLFSVQDSPEWPLERVVAQYQKPPIIIMLIIMASMVFTGITIMHIDYVKRQSDAKKTMTVIAKPSRAIGALYCIVGSLVADFTVLFGKAFSGLLLPTLTGDNQFTSPFVVLIVLVFCVSLPSQIYLIDQSLTVNDALYHIPNFYVFWNVGSIITGAIYYEEMANFELANWLGFFSGVGILFLGVYLTNIAAGKKQLIQEKEENKRIEEEWMGGAGNEDGLHQMYDEAARYDEMWEQAEDEKRIGRVKGEGKSGARAEEPVTEIDYRGQEEQSSPPSMHGSLRDVSLLDASRPGSGSQHRTNLTTPATVDEADEEVMENLMRTLRDATGSDEELEEELAGTPSSLGAGVGSRFALVTAEKPRSTAWQTPEKPAGPGVVRGPATQMGEEEVGWHESADSPSFDDSVLSPNIKLAEATLVGGDPLQVLAPRPYDEDNEDGAVSRVPSLSKMPHTRKMSVRADELSEVAEREREIALWRRRSLRQGSVSQVPSLLDVSWGQEDAKDGGGAIISSAKVPGRVLSKEGAGGLLSHGSTPSLRQSPSSTDWREQQGSWLEQKRRDGKGKVVGRSTTSRLPKTMAGKTLTKVGASGRKPKATAAEGVAPHNLNVSGGQSPGAGVRGSTERVGYEGVAEKSPVSYLVKQFGSSASGRMPSNWYNQSPSPPLGEGPSEGRGERERRAGPSVQSQSRTIAEATRKLAEKRGQDGADSDGSI